MNRKSILSIFYMALIIIMAVSSTSSMAFNGTTTFITCQTTTQSRTLSTITQTRAQTRCMTITSTNTTLSTISSSSTTSSPIVSSSTIGPFTLGYVGCSNTFETIIGYYMSSHPDRVGRLWLPYNTNGGILNKWANPGSWYWSQFDAQVARYGQPSAVWIEICAFTSIGLSYSDVQTFFSILRQHAPSSIYYLSPLNSYATGLCTWALNTDSLASQAVADGLTLQGPLLGPLDRSTVQADGCHPNTQGQLLMGVQLNDFFG